MGFQVMIKDDRDRAMPLFDDRNAPLDDRELSEAKRSAKSAIDHSWSRALSGGEVVVFLVAGLGPPGVMIAWSRLIGPATWISAPGAVIMGILLGGLSARVARGAQARKVRDALLAARRCATCGYSLVEIPPQSDGCAVCPECCAAPL